MNAVLDCSNDSSAVSTIREANFIPKVKYLMYLYIQRIRLGESSLVEPLFIDRDTNKNNINY